MTLSPGTKLGPYEILSPLGAGGMGEVYRARDTRLGRDVAIKVLPQHLSANSEVRARFEREAKTVSSLNHPHICTLFDVGREGDTDFLVMELIDGETLVSRLAKGPLPLADTLRIGSQIADALDRAHRAGVVHRDLKPGNIMLTRSGAKLMDFGLARATGLAGGAGSGSLAGLTQSPTMAQPLTAEGTIVGTFQYMAPEQLEGKETDARSDLWAFGCVLYEMATGHRAFEGKSQASLIGAIMHAEPTPISQIAPLTPPEFDRLVRACLVKDPHDRLQSAHDVKVQLAWLADGARSSSSMSAPAPALAPPRASRRWPALAIAAIVGAALTGLVMNMINQNPAPSSDVRAPQRFLIGTSDLANGSAPAISPDGSFVVFSAGEATTRRLFRRNLSSFEMTPIQGTEEGVAPFFSPDGAWLGFCTPTAIKRVAVNGGVAQVVVTEPRVDSGDWSNDGMIYYCPRDGGAGNVAVARVPAMGGRPEVVARLDSTTAENEAWLPEILPNGTVLASISGGITAWRVVAFKPDGTRHDVVQNGLLARFVDSGHLLYADNNSQAVLCVPFDADVAQVTGPAVPLTEPIAMNNCHDVSRDGTLVYVTTPQNGSGNELVWIDRKGGATLAMETRASWADPRISPDGRKVLVRKSMTSCELWIYDIERTSLARVSQGGDNHDAIWSPDGRQIAFERISDGGKLMVQRVDGTDTKGSERGRPQSWVAAGNLMAYTVSGRGTSTDIWVRSMDAGGVAQPFVTTTFDETTPAISPDGKWIAYTSNQSGTPEVFVRRYPDTGSVWQVSVNGGQSPMWSRDGRELFLRSGAKMMSARVVTTPEFRADSPQVLFEGGFNTNRARDVDVAPDGRFLAVRVPGGQAGHVELRVLLNWPEEMRRVSSAGTIASQ